LTRSIDLFIQSEATLEGVAGDIRRITGATLVGTPDGDGWVLSEGAVEARLGPHPYLDDGELMLQRYRYCLSTTVTGSQRPSDSPGAALLRVVGDLLQRGGGYSCLLVVDLQYRERLAFTGGAPVDHEAPVDRECLGDRECGEQ
jgi:hypothetical protein